MPANVRLRFFFAVPLHDTCLNPLASHPPAYGADDYFFFSHASFLIHQLKKSFKGVIRRADNESMRTPPAFTEKGAKSAAS
jgi:hypothetical protein